MNACKRLKDPIYGYIDIPTLYIKEIIDTAPFQRLRRIIQTSYSPLYASSLHNRFIHSLGVFHLGKIAGATLSREAKKKIEQDKREYGIKININIDRINNIFLLACLLHDVGHAPFSHTGESYYIESKNEETEEIKNTKKAKSKDTGYDSLRKTLNTLVNNKNFKKDNPEQVSQAAAPHEIMSVIIALRNYSKFFQSTEEKDFFARCILGYQYSEIGTKESLKNCFIALLNSKIIDVDRLDYLIRDAFFTGFSSVDIDYERLLSSLTLIRSIDEHSSDDIIKYEPAYYKSAVSVIENVVYAHDAEKKWIQTHPIILYDIYIIQHVIYKLNDIYSTKEVKLFSEKALGVEGYKVGNIKISLLCDDDIVFLMKCMEEDSLSKEYFDRGKRRHPVWKSEAEYRAFLLGTVGRGTALDKFEKTLSDIGEYLRGNSNDWIINDNVIKKVDEEVKKAKEEVEKEKEKSPKDSKKIRTIESNKNIKTRMLKLMKVLQAYANSKDMPCNYVILEASQFSSGFNRPDFSNINIVFLSDKSEEYIKKFSEIVTSLSGNEKPRDRYFYLFYEQVPGIYVDKKEICKKLLGME